jgi:hypothetical protein
MHVGLCVSTGICFGAVVALPSRSTAAASLSGPAGYALFAGGGINSVGAITVPNGDVASNGPISIGTFSKLGGGIYGAGDFNTAGNSPGASTFAGTMEFNGNIYLGSFDTVGGRINAGKDGIFGSSLNASSGVTVGGNYNSSFSQITGDINAGASVLLSNSFDTVTGNVFANQNANVQGTVTGNVTYGISLTTGPFTHINGTTHSGTLASAPQSYVPVALPVANPFISGGADVTNGGTASTPLPPGSYGNLALTGFANLYLGPGNYYFSSLAFNDLTSIHLVNLTAGSPISIYSTGDISGSLFFPTVNGVNWSSADTALASNVLFETLGNFSLSSTVYGSVFAPDGSASFSGGETIDGTLTVGGTINAPLGGLTVFVPEPTSFCVVAGVVPILMRRRRRQSPMEEQRE